MKSKTFCFNATIFKKNIWRFWPLWVMNLCFWMGMLPISMWIDISQMTRYENLSNASIMYNTVYHVLRRGLTPEPVFLVAAVMALAVFSYLYTSRSANMMHALPVNRLELYVTNYVSGLTFLIVPEMLAFMATVLICVGFQITCIQYIFVWLIYVMGITLFAYSFAVFVAMFTGQLLAMPIYYLIINYLYVGCLYIICSLIGIASYGVDNVWNPGASCVLSPIYYIGNNVRVKEIYDADYYNTIGIEMVGGKLVGIYALAAIVFIVIAYQLYKRRQIECAGDMISIGIVKPIFRWGVALCGGIGGTLLASDILAYQFNDLFGWMLVLIIVLGFICFFVAEMLIKKSVRVFQKKRIFEWIGFTVVAIVFISLFRFDAFGIERYIPEEDEVYTAFVEMNYSVEVPKEKLSELREIHQVVIDNKKMYLENAKEDSGYYYTTICYYLKDGKKVERRYPIPIVKNESANTPYGRILEWECETENLRYEILGRDYANNEYFSSYIDRYSKDGRNDTYMLNAQERELILAAIEKDIEAGNFEPYYLYSEYQGKENYYNNITLQYYNKNNIYDNWSYSREYSIEPKSASETEGTSAGNSISFGKKCTNLVETLEELDIINDTWNLISYDEYSKIMGY